MPAETTKRRTPPVNAKLVRVFSVELVPDGGGGFEEAEVEKWSGFAPAFTTEKNVLAFGGNAIADVFHSTVAIPTPLFPSITVETGDLIEYERSGEIQLRKVDGTEDRADYGFIRCHVSEPD